MDVNPGLRFGVVQGRLIQSPAGQLQWFPQDDWESEYYVASAIGFDYIELIAERHMNPANPIWTDHGVARIKILAAACCLSMHALCNDYVIDHPMDSDPAVVGQNLRLLDQAAELGCEKFVLPLFEASELNRTNLKAFVDPLRVIARAAAKHRIQVCLETILPAADLLIVLEELAEDNINVVFDTGNRVAFGHDLPGDIRMLGGRISHVHIKDKNAANENVLLGTGLVNFLEVFKALGDINYVGPYTFETQRGKYPVKTAEFNMGLCSFFYAEGFER